MSVDPALVGEDASSGSGEDMNMLGGKNKRHNVAPGSGNWKRSRKATGTIADTMQKIAAASKLRATAIMENVERFSISKCIKVVDEMQHVDHHLYFLLWTYLKILMPEKFSYF